MLEKGSILVFKAGNLEIEFLKGKIDLEEYTIIDLSANSYPRSFNLNLINVSNDVLSW